MATTGTGRSMFERAKDLITEVAAAARGRAMFGLIVK